MKAADAFARRDREVSFVVRSPRLLSQMLDEGAAVIVENHLKEQGLNVYKGAGVDRIRGMIEAKGVELETGETITGDLVLIGKGVDPNTDFIRNNSIRVEDYGIVVNEYMETTADNIYAAGDVTLAPSFLSGERENNAIWPDAVWQGRVAASNMIGKKRSFAGGINLNALEVLGLAFYAAGKVRIADDEQDKYEIYIRDLQQQGIYRKLVFRDGVLVGAITIGETEDIGVLYTLIKRREKIEDRAEEILKHGISYAQLVKDGIISFCL